MFQQGQSPIIAGQTAYNTAYNTTFPATWPNWGVSRISDYAISFQKPDGTIVSNFPMNPKAIQDEMGEVFDDYGRMSAKLGLELPFTTALNQTFVLQNYVDPPTEIVKNGGVQIWKITHNGVDTHPIHFHLFEVQVLNRVGWDGFIYLPDPNELGWKDTVRVSPLEDTIVALRVTAPIVPFAVPDSVRPLNPAYPIGSTTGFTNIDPLTGQPLAVPTTNILYNFGNEYVWHCHILSHEENDMMRSIVLSTECTNYDAIRALVREYYLNILGREPEPAGWDYWTNEICRISTALGIYIGEGFQAEAKFFFNSAEYLALNKNDNDFVTDLYKTFFLRTPSPAEVASWVAQLNAGLTRNMLITSFAYSPEFTSYMTSLFGPDTTRPENNLLNDLYRGFLSRFPDTGGYNSFLLQMRIAQCQGAQAVRDLCYQISLAFIQSAEYTARNRTNEEYVEDLYNAILRRGADPAGYLAWVNNLNTMSRQQVLQAFTNSTEFQTRVDAVIAAGCLQ